MGDGSAAERVTTGLPLTERLHSADEVIERLRRARALLDGAAAYLEAGIPNISESATAQRRLRRVEDDLDWIIAVVERTAGRSP